MADPLPQTKAALLSDSTILQARDRIVEWVTSHCEGIVNTVRPHAGALTINMIKEQGIASPAVLVSVASGRFTPISSGHDVQGTPVWALYVVTHGNIKDRTDYGIALSEALIKLVVRCPWWAEDADDEDTFSRAPAVPIDLLPLYRDADEKNAYSIWAVTWRQDVGLGSAGKLPALEELTSIAGAISTGNDEDANARILIEEDA